MEITGHSLFNMGKGYEENQERLALLSSFGKNLARRAKSICELSGESGVPLKIYEVAPVPKTPEIERCLLLAESTIDALERPQTLKPGEWRNLGELIWSEEPMVQLMAVRILKAIESRADWAASIIEEAYLDEELLNEAETHPLK